MAGRSKSSRRVSSVESELPFLPRKVRSKHINHWTCPAKPASHCIHVMMVAPPAMQRTPFSGMGLGAEESERKHFWALPSPGGRWGGRCAEVHQVHDPSRGSPALIRCGWLPGDPTPWLSHIQGHRPVVTAGSGLALNTPFLLANTDAPWGSPARLKTHWLLSCSPPGRQA